MRRELGIARCGLACCLCSENADCGGCAECQDKETCENRRCSIERGLESCAACPEEACRKGLLGQLRPRGFFGLSGGLARSGCWTAWRRTSGGGLSTTAADFRGITTALRMRKRSSPFSWAKAKRSPGKTVLFDSFSLL